MSKTMTVCDGIYAVGGPNLSRSEDAYVYLVDAKSCLVLIDAGVGYGNDKIEKNIRSLGSEPAQVWHIIATHCHIDHIGGLHLWRDKYGSKIIAHELDRAGIEGKNNELTAASMYGVDYRPVMLDTILSGEHNQIRLGEMEFKVLHTPGHTPGSISVYIDTPEGRVLFGQDIHGPFSPSWGSDMVEWRRSMRKLLDLEADFLCEGHAGIYRGEEIREYIEGYLRRYSSS